MKFNIKKNYLAGIFLLFLWFFLTANFCLAAFLKGDTQLNIRRQSFFSGDSGGYDDMGNIYSLIQIVINAFLAVIGVLLLIYMLYAGYNWMTAQGEEEKVEKAKDTINRAVVGVIIIIAAYAISVFVISRLEAGTLKGGAPNSQSPSPRPECCYYGNCDDGIVCT